MQRALFVTVRLHEGRYHGLDNRGAREWPPAPARVFQAMISGAARGAAIPPGTQAALDWLETLPAAGGHSASRLGRSGLSPVTCPTTTLTPS